MMTASDLQAVTWRADMGMLWLWVLTGVLAVCAWRALRWRWVSNGLKPAVRWVQEPHPLLWIVLAGALMRLPRLYDSLWYDEAFTARIAGLSAAQFLPAVQGDVHPPLFYAIEWLTARLLGDSEAVLRLPAYVSGLLLIPYGYRLAKAAGLTERTALMYAGVLAVLPAALYYSAEARGYTLLALLVFGALIGLLEDRPWVYLAHAALLPLTHNLGYAYLGLFTLAAAAHLTPARRGVRWGGALMLALIPGVVWLPTMLAQSRDITDGFWLQAMNVGLGLSVYTDMTMSRQIAPNVAGIALTVAIALTGWGAWRYRRWLLLDPRGRLLSLLIFGVPLGVALAAWLWAPVYLTRAMLPVGLGAALLWALLLVEKPLSRLLLGPALLVALVSFYTPGLGRFNMRAAVDVCADAAGGYVTSIPASMFASYYLPEAALFVWEDAGDLNQTLQRDAMRAMGLTAGAFEDVPGPRCILALDTPQTTDAERAHLAALLAAHPHTVTEYFVNDFYTVRVIEL